MVASCTRNRGTWWTRQIHSVSAGLVSYDRSAVDTPVSAVSDPPLLENISLILNRCGKAIASLASRFTVIASPCQFPLLFCKVLVSGSQKWSNPSSTPAVSWRLSVTRPLLSDVSRTDTRLLHGESRSQGLLRYFVDQNFFMDCTHFQ